MSTLLETTKLSDGRFAHFDDGMRRWYIVSAADVEKFNTKYADIPDGYSLWCACTMSEEMPEGWDPAV